jgi:Kazal-type serine protease inhibitor domain
MTPTWRRSSMAAAVLALSLLLPGDASAAGLGQFCGGIANIRCDRGLFCERLAGTCGIFDFGGTCVRVPRICPLIFRPVCGCDGKTYPNDCRRQAARVSKRHDGRCRPQWPF